MVQFDQHHQAHDRKPSIRSKLSLTPFAKRVSHALLHKLRLLYRSDPNFYVLGTTGNVYIVNLSTNPSCTCPDRTNPCKHIFFVLIRVLGVSLDDPHLRRKTLKPNHLARLLATPSFIVSFARQTLRERFHQVFFLNKELGINAASLMPCVEVEEGAMCPICLDEMRKSGDRAVACGTCKIPVHEECLMTWEKTKKKGLTKCVTCRSPWTNKGDQQRYLNLSYYVWEDEMCPKFGGGNKECRHE